MVSSPIMPHTKITSISANPFCVQNHHAQEIPPNPSCRACTGKCLKAKYLSMEHLRYQNARRRVTFSVTASGHLTILDTCFGRNAHRQQTDGRRRARALAGLHQALAEAVD